MILILCWAGEQNYSCHQALARSILRQQLPLKTVATSDQKALYVHIPPSYKTAKSKFYSSRPSPVKFILNLNIWSLLIFCSETDIPNPATGPSRNLLLFLSGTSPNQNFVKNPDVQDMGLSAAVGNGGTGDGAAAAASRGSTAKADFEAVAALVIVAVIFAKN